MGRSSSIMVDDGYRWHKYGAKLVKGTQQRRSYFKCVAPGCQARKKLWKGDNDEEVVMYDGMVVFVHHSPHTSEAAAAFTRHCFPRLSPPMCRHRVDRVDRVECLSASRE